MVLVPRQHQHRQQQSRNAQVIKSWESSTPGREGGDDFNNSLRLKELTTTENGGLGTLICNYTYILRTGGREGRGELSYGGSLRTICGVCFFTENVFCDRDEEVIAAALSTRKKHLYVKLQHPSLRWRNFWCHCKAPQFSEKNRGRNYRRVGGGCCSASLGHCYASRFKFAFVL